MAWWHIKYTHFMYVAPILFLEAETIYIFDLWRVSLLLVCHIGCYLQYMLCISKVYILRFIPSVSIIEYQTGYLKGFPFFGVWSISLVFNLIDDRVVSTVAGFCLSCMHWFYFLYCSSVMSTYSKVIASHFTGKAWVKIYTSIVFFLILCLLNFGRHLLDWA